MILKLIEKLYSLKKAIIKKFLFIYKTYFTSEGQNRSLLTDKRYIIDSYKRKFGKKPNLKNPETFTEKLNWIKLNDRNPNYTIYVDKYAVREYVKDKIGEKYLVPLIGTYWENADFIDFTKFKEKCVFKCNHFSDVIIIENGIATNKKGYVFSSNEELKKYLNKQLKINYYLYNREWPYKDINRKIICEKFMENTNGEDLFDYKIFCFNGVPKFIMLNSSRYTELKTDMYDINWNHLDMQDGHYPKAGDIFTKPECFNEMIELAKTLSYNIPFVRVDFNYWNNKLYFSELTFFHSGGFEYFYPKEWDKILGDWLKLPDKKRRG